MADAKRIAARQSALEAHRANWESLWEEVARFVFPRGDDFRQKHADGAERNQRQYDAFPGLALTRFAAALESGLTPRTTYWHHLRAGDDAIDDDIGVKRYLEKLNEQIWRTRYAPRGNFSSQMHEVYLSLGAFGTGGMLIEARQGGGILYRSIHLSELFVCQNADGIVDTVHRKFELTARQAVQKFGDDVPQKIRKAMEKGNSEDKFEFLHVVEPREDYRPGAVDLKGQRFASYYLHEGAMVEEDGFHEMPYIVPRYMTSSREIYGRGPAIMLLPDIKMLQEMRRTTIEAANLVVDPPVLLHDADILSEFTLMPGARNFGGVDENGRQLAIPFQSGADVGLGLEMIQDTRGQIDDAFLGVYFRVLLENPNMTATQALLIAQQQGQMTAPVIGRLQSEALGPMIRRESGILFRQGKHPEMPPQLAEYLMSERRPLEIEYESPMTRAAETEKAVSVLRSYESLAPIAQIEPKVLRRFNWDEVAEIVAESNGMPSEALYSDEEMRAKDEEAQQQQTMATMLTAAPIAADTAEKLARAQQIAASTPQPVAAE